MAAISLKLPDGLLEETGQHALTLHLSRAAYMRRAIEQMNQEMRSQLRAERLAIVSRRVRDESMRVNADFAAIERDPGGD